MPLIVAEDLRGKGVGRRPGVSTGRRAEGEEGASGSWKLVTGRGRGMVIDRIDVSSEGRRRSPGMGAMGLASGCNDAVGAGVGVKGRRQSSVD